MSYFVGYNRPSWSEAFKICPIFFSWEPVEKVTAFCLLLPYCEQRFVPGMRASHRRSFSDFPIVWRSCFRTHPEPTGGLLLLTNKMAVNGTKPAESLRHLACSLAALNPAPWEKVRSEIFRKTIYSLLTLGTKWSEMCWNYFEYSREGSETSAYMYVYLGMRTRISAQNFYVIGSTTWR